MICLHGSYDGSLLNLFQMVGACLSIYMAGLIVVLFVVFLCSGFRSPLNLLLCFITAFLLFCFFFIIIICISL